MKRYYLVIFLLFISSFNNAFSQATTNIPQYTLEAKNFNLINTNQIAFDLVFTHTDTIPLELAGWQFFFKVPFSLGTFPFSHNSFRIDTINGEPITDLPLAFRPRKQIIIIANNSPGYYELRMATNSLPGAGNGLMIPQGLPILIGRYKLNSTTPLNPEVLYNNQFIIRDSCEIPLSVTRTKMNFYNENSFNQEFTRCASHSVDLSGLLPLIVINIKLAIEGLYTPVSNVSLRKDTLTVYLARSVSPFNFIDTSVNVIDSITLSAVFTFRNTVNGTYYIVLKHHNSLETWSKAGGEFFEVGNIYNYDFTASAAMAFGNNLILKGSVYCIYSGDVNQDYIIDISDLSDVDNDVFIFASGYKATDFNGDYIVEGIDMSIIDNNRNKFIRNPIFGD